MVANEKLLCPGCSGDLMVNQVDGLRQYVCVGCGGTVLTIAVLRQLEGDLAGHIWTEPPSSASGEVRCPFCSQPMQPKALPALPAGPIGAAEPAGAAGAAGPAGAAGAAGPAGAAAICRPCEAAWLDKQAVLSLPDKSAPPRPTLASESLKCAQCGAPVANSWDEKCQFCGASLHAPTQVVVLPTSLPGEEEQAWGPWRLPHRPSLYSSVLKRIIEGGG
jgi:DNA-directed RNA polymerase subunit RPC12/RpoP